MSAGDESSLEQRALAAAAAAGPLPMDPHEAWLRKQRQEQAEREQALVASAIRNLEQILGHRTNPVDWQVSYEDRAAYARTTLMGLHIRTWRDSGMRVLMEGTLEAGRKYTNTGRGREYVDLTLASFGRALEAFRNLEPVLDNDWN